MIAQQLERLELLTCSFKGLRSTTLLQPQQQKLRSLNIERRAVSTMRGLTSGGTRLVDMHGTVHTLSTLAEYHTSGS